MEEQCLNNRYPWFKHGLDDNFHKHCLKLRLNNRPLESKWKLDKQVTHMTHIDLIFDSFRYANTSEKKEVDDLVNKGKRLFLNGRN